MAKCCSYRPIPVKLNGEFEVWKFLNPGHAREEPDIEGQLRQPDLSQGGDEEGGTMYLFYGIVDRLRDVWDYGNIGEADVIVYSVLSSGGRQVGYRVQEIQEVSYGFSNECLRALLRRLTPSELATIQGVPPTEDPVDPEQSSITHSPSPSAADGIDSVNICVTARRTSGVVAPGQSISIFSTSATETIAAPTGVTGLDGKYCTTATNTTEETTTVSAGIIGAGVVGPSQPVVWNATGGGGGGTIQDLQILNSWFENGTCANCNDLYGGHFMNQIVDGGTEWDHVNIGWPCGDPGDYTWFLAWDGTAWLLTLTLDGSEVARWGLTGSPPPVTYMTVFPISGTGLCDFNKPIDVRNYMQ